MDELGGLLGGLVAIVFVIYALVWLIAIIVTIVVAASLIAGPPVGLGVLLKRLLTRRYELSERKRQQCAGIVAASFALPFLVLFVDSSQTALLVAAWAGIVMSMSNFALYLSISAYRQHFALHRKSMLRARRGAHNGRLQQFVARVQLWRLDKKINSVERRQGHLLRAHEDLTAQMNATMEKGDPALLQIKLNHWEREYTDLPTNALAAKQADVASELLSGGGAVQAVTQLHAQFLDALVIRKKLSTSGGLNQYQAMVDDRNALRSTIAMHGQKIESCRMVQAESAAKIRDLKSRKLVIQ